MIKHALALVVLTAVAAKAPPPKGGTIVGTIHFKGKAPVMPVIDKSRDPPDGVGAPARSSAARHHW